MNRGTAFFIVMALAGSFARGDVLDQAQEDLDFSLALIAGDDVQQEVTAGLTGQLSRVAFYAIGDVPIELFVRDGAPWQVGPKAFSMVVTPPNATGFYTVDVLSAGLAVTAGQPFTVGLAGVSSTRAFNSKFSPLDPYAGGMMYVNGVPYSNGFADLVFRTYVVPEPMSLALLGLGGVILLRRRS